MCNFLYNIFILLFFNLLFLDNVYSQESVDSTSGSANFILKEVLLESKESSYSRSDYFKLKRKIFKTYRYVDSVRLIINDLEYASNKIQKKRILNKYFRVKQRDVKNTFSKEIRKLTRSEGVLLSKMIYREFDVSVYELIAIYRGRFRARFWHQIAQLYDGDLKIKFNNTSIKEDQMIESIINDYLE